MSRCAQNISFSETFHGRRVLPRSLVAALLPDGHHCNTLLLLLLELNNIYKCNFRILPKELNMSLFFDIYEISRLQFFTCWTVFQRSTSFAPICIPTANLAAESTIVTTYMRRTGNDFSRYNHDVENRFFFTIYQFCR